MPSGAKTWIVEYRPGAGGRKIFKRRMKINLATRCTGPKKNTAKGNFQHECDSEKIQLPHGQPANKSQQSRRSQNSFSMSTPEPPNIKPNARRLYAGNLLKLVVPIIGSLKA